MAKIRYKKIDKIVSYISKFLSDCKLSREELIIIISDILIRVGYTFYYLHENPSITRPDSVNSDFVWELYKQTPSTGTTLMKAGFDLREVLIEENGE